SRARDITDLFAVALHQGQENLVGLVDRQRCVHPTDKRLHGGARRAGPAVVDRTVLAADTPKFTLQLPRQGCSIVRSWWGNELGIYPLVIAALCNCDSHLSLVSHWIGISAPPLGCHC